MLSTMTRLSGDLYASSKTLFKYLTLLLSLNRIMFSGEISLAKGNSLFFAIKAANAVFPDPGGP